MAFQAVPNVISLQCNFLLLHLIEAHFTVYCENDAEAWDGAAMATKAEAVADAIVAEYVPLMSQDHDFIGVTARDLEVQYGRVVEFPVAATPGGIASPSLPTQVAPVVKWRAEVGAPRLGFAKLMAPAENQVVGNLISGGTTLADLTAAMDALRAAITDGVGPSHVILSRYSGMHNVDGPNDTVERVPTQRGAVLTNNVQAGIVNPILGTQKSRRI